MTLLGAGFLAGAAILAIWIVIAIVQDSNDGDDINLKEYDDWERLRGPSPACAAALLQNDSDAASSDVASLGGNGIAGLAQQRVTEHDTDTDGGLRPAA